MKFNAEVAKRNGQTTICISGWLDERAELPEIDGRIDGDLIIDLSEVTLLTSLGARNWMLWQQSLTVEKDVVLVNCSPAVVKQINILEGFLNDRTKIDTICVPYFCEDCDHEESRLVSILELRRQGRPAPIIQPYRCPECGLNMELDMVESEYLAFVEKQKSKF